MHTLLIHQAFASSSDTGGTRHLELARYVVEAGDKFTIVASDVNYGTGIRVTSRAKFMTEERLDGVRVLRTFTPALVRKSYFLRVIAFIAFMISATVNALRAGNVDVVMGTSPPIFQALSALTVAAIRSKPLLLEIRDLWPEFAVDIGILKSPFIIAISRRLENFLYSHADRLLVNSPAYRTYLIDKGVPEQKITIVANGVEPGLFFPDSDGALARRQLGLQGKFVATYAGALGRANDLETLIRAADRLRSRADIQILLVGDGQERERLQTEVANRNLKNVIFAGPKPKRDIPEILAASDACIAILKNIPMFRTTYPNKVFDYMAAARPTVLAIDGAIREVIEEAHGGIYAPPGDDVALANAIVSLADDRIRSHQMGASAREYVVQHFNRADQAADFLRLLHSVAGIRVEDASAT
jgi:glycosyltransferase involved in cell wall biosynthesis